MNRNLSARDPLRVPTSFLFLFITSFITLFTFSLFAQQTSKQITGKVTDNQGSLPLAGVSIVEKGSGVGHRTDSNGIYRINVPGNTAVLIFSSVGYKSQEISIGGRTTIDVALVSEAWDKTPDADDHTAIFPLGQTTMQLSPQLKQNKGY